MYKKVRVFIAIIPLLLLSVVAEAQSFRVSYYFYKYYDSEGDGITKRYRPYMDMVLDVSGNRSAFYSESAFIADSLNNLAFDKHGQIKDKHAYAQRTRITPRIYDATLIDFTDASFVQYYRWATVSMSGRGVLSMPNWRIGDETDIIAGYTCKKASAEYLGREWTVWFTEDIPAHTGPWLLWGAPGLILKAKDTDNLFSFIASAVEPLSDLQRFFFLPEYIRENRALSHYDYDFKECERMHNRLESDIDFQNQITNSRTVSVKNRNGQEITLKLPPYLPLVPDEYWKRN